MQLQAGGPSAFATYHFCLGLRSWYILNNAPLNVTFHKMLGRGKAVWSANLLSTNLNCGKESLSEERLM